jgi:hypothetical protein
VRRTGAYTCARGGCAGRKMKELCSAAAAAAVEAGGER